VAEVEALLATHRRDRNGSHRVVVGHRSVGAPAVAAAVLIRTGHTAAAVGIGDEPVIFLRQGCGSRWVSGGSC
jgi:hypothetical protein